MPLRERGLPIAVTTAPLSMLLSLFGPPGAMTSVAESRPTIERGHDEERYPGLRAFYAHAFPKVMARTVYIVRDTALAQDLVQEAFVELTRVWATRHTLPVEQNVAYVRRIVANMAISSNRRARAWARIAPLLLVRHRRTQAIAHVESDVLARDAVRRIVQIGGKRQRAIAVLYFIDEMTSAEIAVELSISPSTVRTHLQRIRDRLASEANEHDEIQPSTSRSSGNE